MANIYAKSAVNLMVAGSWVMEQLNIFFKEYDLTVQQYNILRILRGQKGNPINLFMLQEHMIHKMSNTTRLVEKLRAKGFVDRRQCESNRRKIEILITKQGLEKLEEIDVKIVDYEKNMLKDFTTEDCELLNTLLEKIK